MGIFIRIETGDHWPGSSPAPRFFGVLVADKVQAVANYELVPLPRDRSRYEAVARIERYPRWSEPALALCARLIEQSEPDFLADPVRALPLTVTVSVGASPDSTEVVELMTTQRGLDGFGVIFVSQLGHVLVRMPTPRPDVTVREAVLAFCRGVFGWHHEAVPLPKPLTLVPILDGSHGPLVALADIPPHPRGHLRLRHGLDDFATTVPARLWLEFIGQAMPDNSAT